jgi:hypothetical protein
MTQLVFFIDVRSTPKLRDEVSGDHDSKPICHNAKGTHIGAGAKAMTFLIETLSISFKDVKSERCRRCENTVRRAELSTEMSIAIIAPDDSLYEGASTLRDPIHLNHTSVDPKGVIIVLSDQQAVAINCDRLPKVRGIAIPVDQLADFGPSALPRVFSIHMDSAQLGLVKSLFRRRNCENPIPICAVVSERVRMPHTHESVRACIPHTHDCFRLCIVEARLP